MKTSQNMWDTKKHGASSNTSIPWTYLGSVPDHHNKTSHTKLFGFPVHVKIIFILYCSLISMQ